MTSVALDNCGNSLPNMRLRDYKAGLRKRLENPRYAAEYLAQVLAERDKAAFLIALEDVVEASGAWAVWPGASGSGVQARTPLLRWRCGWSPTQPRSVFRVWLRPARRRRRSCF
jgi:hypothetical protein